MGTAEDTFVIPSSWLRAIRPRRGGAPAGFSPAATWAADIATLIAKRPSLRTSLTDPETPRTCVARASPATPRWARQLAGTGLLHTIVAAAPPVTVSEIIRDLREVVQ